MPKQLTFIDLFAGMGGTRLGFSAAAQTLGRDPKCVFTSEIKEHARSIYQHNFEESHMHGDITLISENDIPDFDVLLGGFPCQAFSQAGSRRGFADTRGTLFFDIARIIDAKKPSGFLLENVEGLVKHDLSDKSQPIGNTLTTILGILYDLGYKTSWKVLDSKDFGIAQSRKRIYIAGSKYHEPNLRDVDPKHSNFSDIQDANAENFLNSPLSQKLLSKFKPEELYGKAIKDKRGGRNNIHSWDLELKGPVTHEQAGILSKLLTERRKKKWAIGKNIDWMDGMSLTLDEIHSFTSYLTRDRLKELLDDLCEKNYLRFEHPKKRIEVNGSFERVPNVASEKGYNIVAGKLSYEISKIIDPAALTPTIVASDCDRLAVVDNEKLRRLTQREGLRLFGFPECYKSNLTDRHLYDLIGNTVVVPVIEWVSKSIIETFPSPD